MSDDAVSAGRSSIVRNAGRVVVLGGAAMNESLPYTEFPACVTRGDLNITITAACDLAELRIGYKIELALLEPVERDGQLNMRAYWRPKTFKLAVAA